MAKTKTASNHKIIAVSSICAQDALIFRQTFVASMWVNHKVPEDRAMTVFDECLQRRLIVPARKVGSPPGVQLYQVAMAFVELKIKIEQ